MQFEQYYYFICRGNVSLALNAMTKRDGATRCPLPVCRVDLTVAFSIFAACSVEVVIRKNVSVVFDHVIIVTAIFSYLATVSYKL